MRRRTVVLTVVVVIALVGEAAPAVSAFAAHRLQDRREANYGQTRATLDELEKSVHDFEAKLASTQHQLGDRDHELADARASLANAQKLLPVLTRQVHDAGQQSLQAQATLAAAKFCSDAEVLARVLRKGSDAAGVVVTLRKAEPSCATAVAAHDPDPPVYPFDFPDPSITRVGDTYYAYATNGPLGNVQLATSTDLRHWTVIGDALPILPAWADPGNVWAPSVVSLADKFVMYYSPRTKGGNQCISVAVASSPLGPFVDNSLAPFECTSGYALDPKPFVDGQGQAWLVWKNGVGDAIWSQPLRPDGLALMGSPAKLISADQAWEQRNVEGPSLVETDGVLRLFYSASAWTTARYAVGEAICETPAGPCRKPQDGPVLASHDATAGPGGADFFTTSDGRLWATFHAYKTPNVGYPSSRLLHVAPVHFDGDALRLDSH
jgi:Glycosyl hydrolases family 43